MRAVRAVIDIPPAQLIPLGELLLATVVITLPTSLALGAAFPLACDSLASAGSDARSAAEVRDISWSYVLEAAGEAGADRRFQPAVGDVAACRTG